MANDDILILNNLGNLKQRKSSTGRVRYTVEVKSEPLVHNLDPKTLGSTVASAIAEELRRQVKAITQQASKSTLDARQRAAKAFGAGASWAAKAYGGGKIGAMPPNQSSRAWNDSGRFAAGIVAQAKDDSWTINIPANRLNPTLLRDGELGVARMWRSLVALVPAFENTALLFQTDGVKKGVDTSIRALITKAGEMRDQLTAQRARAMLGLTKQIGGALRLVG